MIYSVRSSVLAVATLAPAALAQTTFSNNNYPSCPAPSGIASADVDLDGDRDLVTAHTSTAGDMVCANRNLGGGTSWANATLFTYAAGSGSRELVVAELDGAGRPDIAVVLSGTFQMSIHLATGAWPGFAAPQLVPIVGVGIEAVSLDLEGDGDLDLAVLCQNPSVVNILRNNGSGVYANVLTIPLSISPHAIARGNLNLGGQPDLVVTGSAGTWFADVLINTSVGTTVSFAPEQMFPCDARPFGVCTGDLNEDGYTDIAVAGAAFSMVTVLLNDPGAMSGTTVGFVGASYPLAPGVIAGPCTEIACGDFDCDADVDLAVTCNATNDVALLWNNGGGTGSFSAPWFEPAPTGCCDLVLDDFDGDGWRDIATANPPSNDVSVLLNALNVGCCRHVLIGGISDGFSLVTPFGPEDTCPAADLMACIGSGPVANFDQFVCDQRFQHTFRGLPRSIKSAFLRMRVRADCGGSNNDALHLGLDTAGCTLLWGQSIQTLTGVTWNPGAFGGIGLDLGNLPGGTSLLGKMSLDGRLDVYIQDDTSVDSIELVIETCSKSSVDMSYTHTPLIWGTSVTFSVSGAPTPPSGFAVLIGPALGNGPSLGTGIPPLCIVQPSLFQIAPTTSSGTGSVTIALPAIAFPPCITLASQAIAWDSTFTLIELSNTMTQQFFD